MRNITFGFSGALVLLGIGAYVMTGMRSVTALIPSFAGLLLFGCGLLAGNPGLKRHAMHAAVVVALLGFAGSVTGVVKLVQWAVVGEKPLTAEQRAAENLRDDQIMLNSGSVIRPVAAKVQGAMAGILAAYIALCVKSFIDARRSSGG